MRADQRIKHFCRRNIITDTQKTVKNLNRVFFLSLIIVFAPMFTIETDPGTADNQKRSRKMVVETNEKYSSISFRYVTQLLNPLDTQNITMEYIPDGFVVLEGYDKAKKGVYLHFASDEEYFKFSRRNLPDTPILKDLTPTDEVVINDYIGAYGIINGICTIEWSDSQHAYSLVGSVPINEMMKIAENTFSKDE